MQVRRWFARALWITGLLLSLASAALLLFLVLNVVAFPLELEVRESPVWLHVLALRAGINVFIDETHIFINMSHGPMDTLLKAGLGIFMPFLSSHVVTRIFVLGVPLALWTTVWVLLRKKATHPVVWATLWAAGLYALLNGLPGVTGYNLLIGRSDATALFFFLLLILVSEIKVTQDTSLLFRGLAEGLLMGLCALTNTRFVAAVGAYYLYVLLTNRFIIAPPRHMIIKRVSGASIALVVMGLIFLFGIFKGDLRSYYLHFFGHFLDSRAHALVPIAPFVWFPEQLFSGNRTPLLVLWLIVMLLESWTYRRQRRTQIQRLLSVWLPLVALYLATIVGYWLNRRGGGTYYFNPWIVWLFVASLRSWMGCSRRLQLVTGIAIVGVGLATANWPSIYSQAIEIYRIQPEASDFRKKMEALDRENPILSEDAFFFKNEFNGVVIDMGDTVEAFANKGFGTPEFRDLARRYFADLESHPPKYVYIGGAASSHLSQLVARRYRVLLTSPPCMQANGPRPTFLYVRRD